MDGREERYSVFIIKCICCQISNDSGWFTMLKTFEIKQNAKQQQQTNQSQHKRQCKQNKTWRGAKRKKGGHCHLCQRLEQRVRLLRVLQNTNRVGAVQILVLILEGRCCYGEDVCLVPDR